MVRLPCTAEALWDTLTDYTELTKTTLADNEHCLSAMEQDQSPLQQEWTFHVPFKQGSFDSIYVSLCLELGYS